MRNGSRSLMTTRLLLVALLSSCGGQAGDAQAGAKAGEAPRLKADARQSQRWNFFLAENQIDQLWLDLSQRHRSEPFAITDVNLIDPSNSAIRTDQTVLVDAGMIQRIGPTAQVRVPDGWRLIDGTSRYLMPGLVDMHTHHLVTNSQHLLNLMHGVTTVRDMSGFKWMLSVRDRISTGQLLGPTMYLAGHILSSSPLQYYATVVGTPDAARQEVREQVRAGFDFVKLHNGLQRDVYQAVIGEAKRLRVAVIGHVPGGITLAEAIDAGQRTIEHFKGYIVDSTLAITDEDYLAATQGRELWNCPTLAVHYTVLRGEEARSRLAGMPLGLVNPSDRHDWGSLAEGAPQRIDQIRGRVLEHSKKILGELTQIDAKFVAGTDSGGGLPFLIPGLALHEELAMLSEAGLDPWQVLRTATVEAAAAMGRSDEFGTVTVGKRADLVLLEGNPLEDLTHLNRPSGVATRGRWLSAEDIAEILAAIADAYRLADSVALDDPPLVTDVEALVTRMEEMRSEGFIFRGFDLGELARLLTAADRDDLSRRVRFLRSR